MDNQWNASLQPADVLATCRQRIDRIDGVLLALLRERLVTAAEAADAKAALGQPVLAPPREAEVLARVTTLASSPLDAEAAVRIFQTIIEETRATELRWLATESAESRSACP